MVRHRGRYTHSPFRSGWVVTRDLLRTVLEAIEGTPTQVQRSKLPYAGMTQIRFKQCFSATGGGTSSRGIIA
jgi:hypothetical protein